jgi:capsular exopolysaccharide synthesis family protein
MQVQRPGYPPELLAGVPVDALSAEPPGRLLPSITHGLRRKWLIVVTLGAVCAGGAGFVVWSLTADSYTAKATLKIGGGLKDAGSEREMDVFKANQQETVYQPEVIDAALALPTVSSLRIVKDQGLDVAQWLRSLLRVSFRDKSEYMEISFSCEDRTAALTIVDAVAAKYQEVTERFAADREEHRRVNLAHSTLEIQQKLEDKHQQLGLYGNPAGGDLSANLTDDQRLAVARLSSVERELFEVGLEIGTLEIDQKALLTSVPSPESPAAGAAGDPEQELLLASDKQIEVLRRQIAIAERRIEGYATTLAPGVAQQYALNDRKQIERLEGRIVERREAHLKELQMRRRLAESVGRQKLADQIAELRQREEVLKASRDELKAAIPADTGSSIKRYLIQAEIETLESLLNSLSLENERVGLEHQSLANRVQRNPAVVPYTGDKSGRLIKCGAAGGFAWMLAAACIVGWDVRRRRLNSIADVTHELGMPLIGTLPLLKRSRSGAQASSNRLSEAVDGIAATLLCGNEGRHRQVVQVSSASPGEGKSTLAANLATSLSAAGRNVLLVDFDLRRPMLHRVYQLELGPGVSEILTGSARLDEALQPTSGNRLVLLSAGHWREKGLGALTDARIEVLFQECRSRFDFVIVDTSPILPVVDGRLASRHVDGVIFSLLRDVSEIPKVAAAVQMLESFGAPIMGGVMIGSSQDVYYGYAHRPLTQTA